MKILRIITVVLVAAVLARESLMAGSQLPPARAGEDSQRPAGDHGWLAVAGGVRRRDPALLNRESGGVVDVLALKSRFEREGQEERRKALMPFLWSVIAKEGQIFGDADAGREAKVTNGRNFSYPGYNEIFTGWADPDIDSNEKVPNRNISVLEWLNRKEEFRDRIAAFGSWDVFPFILNRGRSRLRVQAAWSPPTSEDLSDEERVVATLMAETPRVWEECCFDAFTFRPALGYLKRNKPRVLYVGLGETDEWAHAGRYDQYLEAAHRVTVT